MKKIYSMLILIVLSLTTIEAQVVLENHMPPIGSGYNMNSVALNFTKALSGGYRVWDYSTLTTTPMYTFSNIAKSAVSQALQDSFPNVTYIEMLSLGAPDINLNPMIFYKDMGTHLRQIGQKGSGSTSHPKSDTFFVFNQAYQTTLFYHGYKATYVGYGQLKIKTKTFDSVAMFCLMQPPSLDSVIMFYQIKPYFAQLFGYSISSDTISQAYYYDPSSLPSGVSELQATSDIELYPNPASKEIHIRAASHELIEQIFLYNSTGQLLYVQPAQEEQEMLLDIRKYPKGIYMVSIQSAKRTVLKKILID